MSFKDVARELYRVQQRVAQLEKALPLSGPEDEAHLMEQLREAQAERRQLQNIINGRKATPLERKIP
ncbi:MAG: hypothetical protein ACOY3Z_12235 [Thermodesulfobacteriota bacterium]